MSVCTNRTSMGIGDFDINKEFIRKNRWMMSIQDISGDIGVLPPNSSARPHVELKEQQLAHIVEDIYYPVRPEWSPINLTLYDIYDNVRKTNPVFEWLKIIYDTTNGGNWYPTINNRNINNGFKSNSFKRNASLCLYDGCGCLLEGWVYENAYPKSIDWGELNMEESGIVFATITLRYDRAYIIT